MSSIRKKRTAYAVAQLVLAAALAGGIGYSFMAGDTNGPEIEVTERTAVLSGNMTEEQLIAGVIATDDVDNDVSDTLKIESVTQITDDRVLIVYAARDKSNNVTTTTETAVTDGTFEYKDMIEAGGIVQNNDVGDLGTDSIGYPADSGVAESVESTGLSDDSVAAPVDDESVPTDESLPADTESIVPLDESVVPDTESVAIEDESVVPDTESAAESEGAESTVESEVSESTDESVAESEESTAYTYDSEMSTEDSYSIEQYVNTATNPSTFTDADISKLNENLRHANNMSISRLPDGYPVIRLNTYAIKKSASESFSALSYISDIRDDADPSTDIFGRISVSGNVGLDKPGIYTVNYYVTDSEGQRSNVAHLVVVVS